MQPTRHHPPPPPAPPAPHLCRVCPPPTFPRIPAWYTPRNSPLLPANATTPTLPRPPGPNHHHAPTPARPLQSSKLAAYEAQCSAELRQVTMAFTVAVL